MGRETLIKMPDEGEFYYFLARDNGKLVVSLNADGSVTFGEGYAPDEAAMAFWEAVKANRPSSDIS